MIIGTFVYDKASDSFSGDISTLHFQINGVEIKPVDNKADKGPDYRLIFETSYGHVELGAAWKRKAKGKNGREYISVELDAPQLDKPLYAAMFLGENGTAANLVWNRLKDEAED